MDVRSFKLLTGEELIAKLVSPTGQGYIIETPLVVHVLRGPDGQGTLAFAPWSMVQKDDSQVELYDHALACKPVEVVGEVETSYISQVTGLSLPPNGRILHG